MPAAASTPRRAGWQRFDHDGRTYWHAPGEGPPADPSTSRPRGHLLQILDESYRGYQDSRWVLDAAGIVPRSREPAIGMALVDGQLLAMARRTVTAERVSFDVHPYRRLRSAEIDALGTPPTVTVSSWAESLTSPFTAPRDSSR